MSKRAHRKRVKGTPTNRATQKLQYIPNKRRKYAFETGEVL